MNTLHKMAITPQLKDLKFTVTTWKGTSGTNYDWTQKSVKKQEIHATS